MENPGNRGKGYSVRNGMLQAHGGVVVFSDADLSSPIEELPKLLRGTEDGADIAIGSRWLQSETQTQRQPFHRQLFGRVFNLSAANYSRLAVQGYTVRIQGIQTAEQCRRFSRCRKSSAGDSIPEILFLARKFGFRVQEVPCMGT